MEFGCSMLRILGPRSLLPQIVSWLFHPRRGKLRGPQTMSLLLPLSSQLLQWEYHSERTLPLSPTTSFRALAQRFAQREKRTIKQIAPNLFPHLQQRTKKLKPKSILKYSGGCGKRHLRGDSRYKLYRSLASLQERSRE